MPPGRSGHEFIARLIELERFAASEEAFNPDPYAGSADTKPAPTGVFARIKEEHKFEPPEKFSPVRPYRALNASRLKLSGSGGWPMEDHLNDILWLPFLEPLVVKHGGKISWPGPDFSRESVEENEKLLKLWDARGLLALFPDTPEAKSSCRVFNAHKNETTDRQIGDRRWVNGSEMHPTGPSAFLPAGSSITATHCPRGKKLVGCASDRKDFYHQARVTRQRAFSNALPFAFNADHWRQPEAFKEMIAFENRPRSRATDGDRYGMAPRALLVPEKIATVAGDFKTLFQGDHLGVEFALSSHTAMLRDGGLLDAESQILRHHPFPRGPVWQGLVIDDYFAISCEPAGSAASGAASVAALDRAEEIYSKEKVLGSDDKTVRGAEAFKVIGAEVLSDELARRCGSILVSAPASKRVPMICLTLAISRLPCISKSLAARIAGNWVSIFMYRRPLCCILNHIFAFGSKSLDDADDVVPLPRKVAEELALAGVFGLAALCDISVPYDKRIYATDASSSKGAFTSLYDFWGFKSGIIQSVALLSRFYLSHAMPLLPTGADEQRRAERRTGRQLQADRVILQQTRSRRETLLAEFDRWLSENWMTTLENLIGGNMIDGEAVCEALVTFGKDMYNAGKSYGKYSETIKAITARRSVLRKQVSAAWDLAFNWVTDEPHEHHAALPVSIMLACTTLAILWGWLREGALIAMTWTGVLRVGEVLSALRADLILPRDAAPSTLGALLQIRLPKTRGRAARHQSSRIEPDDIVQLLDLAFRRLNIDERLWPWSPSRLRRRFSLLLTALGVADSRGSSHFNLSSLRPGGATYWLAQTEDAEFVRRKGRWLSTRVLEIYLQEASVATYQRRLTEESKSRIQDLCNLFPEVLKKAQFFKAARIPEDAWPKLW